MSIIKVMPSNLSNKIAAGEVVETLMNVVKELVENSIDAKATEIKVSLIDSGIGEIKVSDDGVGMDKEDAVNTLKRHATSKLYDDDDLFNINTLGFRGEALPSIASVSKMSIKTSKDDIGTEVIVHGGKIISIENSDLRQGTTITVKDIFYNTPARLKYLKSLYTELANITNYLNKMALANPNIKFVLTNNDKELLNTDGSNNILKVINNIYGLNVVKKMCHFKTSNSDYDVECYMSYPEISRSNRNSITILVNGRNVRCYDLNRSILDAYHTYMPKDKFPIIVLYITTDPSIIDVNIHPTKMEIKFSKIDNLKELIFDSISKNLEKLTLIPEAKYEDRPISNIDEVTTISNKVDFTDKTVVEPKFEDLEFDFDVEETPTTYEDSKEPKAKFKMINPLCLVHGTYIIGENEDGMYIMDQHAVNERINYEYYKKELGKENNETIALLVPIKIELSNNEYIILKQNFDILDRLKIKYEEFGINTIIIREHPTWIKKDRVEESLRKIIDIIVTCEDFSVEKFNEQIAITLSCKMAIKANEHISIEEMRNLILRLRETENPFTCPHGRPTIISYSKYELEKMFKRVM